MFAINYMIIALSRSQLCEIVLIYCVLKVKLSCVVMWFLHRSKGDLSEFWPLQSCVVTCCSSLFYSLLNETHLL